MRSKHWFYGLALCVGVASFAPPASALTPSDVPHILHLLNRLSFGPLPGDVERVEAVGIERYIQEQLQPDAISEPSSLTDELSHLPTLSETPNQILREYGPTTTKLLSQDQIKNNNDRERQVREQAQQAWIAQSLHSSRQLQAVMTDFWFNHFNVFVEKGQDRWWVGNYIEQAIRPHALGRFRDLLEATAHHPAMLYYLDNFQSSAQRVDAKGRKQGGINENYARELMELHTLGVDGGYTQKDVTELARILTGWGIAKPSEGEGFFFDADRHDKSDKLFLGKVISGNGIQEGEQALDILAKSPATAHHISYALAQYFVSDDPPAALVNHLKKRFLETDGNIREVLYVLFESKEFWDSRYISSKFKTPQRYILSTIRAAGLNANNYGSIVGLMNDMGMPLFGCVTPDGYQVIQDRWLNSDALNKRLSYAVNLGTGTIPLQMDATGKRQNSPAISTLALLSTFSSGLSNLTMTTIIHKDPKMQAALILGSSDLMHY